MIARCITHALHDRIVIVYSKYSLLVWAKFAEGFYFPSLGFSILELYASDVAALQEGFRPL